MIISNRLSQLISVVVCMLVFNNVFGSSLKLSELLVAIASSSEKKAKFTETRMADFLAKPLVSTGVLEFKAPATLIKIITSPTKIHQTIIGDELTLISEKEHDSEDIENFDNTQIVSLSSYPELEIGINAIRWVLSGNYQALQKSFNIKFINNKPGWQLSLQPKDIEVLNNIFIKGRAAHITQIKITQKNGESIITDLYEHQ